MAGTSILKLNFLILSSNDTTRNARTSVPSPRFQIDEGCASAKKLGCVVGTFLVFFFTLVTGPSRSLSLKLSDTKVYGPQIRVRLGTTRIDLSPPFLDTAPFSHSFFYMALKPRVE